jgi:hypothetical protein
MALHIIGVSHQRFSGFGSFRHSTGYLFANLVASTARLLFVDCLVFGRGNPVDSNQLGFKDYTVYGKNVQKDKSERSRNQESGQLTEGGARWDGANATFAVAKLGGDRQCSSHCQTGAVT